MLRVLIVDDHCNTRETLAIGLRECGFKPITASRALEAVESLRIGGVDLVVSDVRMPGATGIELAAQIRREHRQVPIILMTAYDLDPGERAECDAVGVVVLIKPVTVDVLVRHCRVVAGRPAAKVEAPSFRTSGSV